MDGENTRKMKEEELIKITEYEVDREIIKKCIEEEREITKKDAEMWVQEILTDSGIECKTKLTEKWGPVGRYGQSKYSLIAEVFVYKKDFEKAKEILAKLN